MKKKYIAIKPFNNKIYYNNNIFKIDSSAASLYLINARNYLAKKNIILNTIDIVTKTPSEKDVYFDLPYLWELKHWIRILKNRKKNILFIIEPPVVNPFSYMKISHIFFVKVYTWNDDLVDNKKYFKMDIPKTDEGMNTQKVSFMKKKFLVLMNANWVAFLPFKLLAFSTRELYSQRIKAIEFFTDNFPLDFSLYGRGWNKPARFSIEQRLFGHNFFSSYKGVFSSEDKYKILSQFKFALCFENCERIGYISEKIIDFFKARCVPIYLGAPNIGRSIDQKCFIDFRKFKSLEDLARYLLDMDEKTYNTYIQEIEKFLRGNYYKNRWTSTAFIKLFEKSIL